MVWTTSTSALHGQPCCSLLWLAVGGWHIRSSLSGDDLSIASARIAEVQKAAFVGFVEHVMQQWELQVQSSLQRHG